MKKTVAAILLSLAMSAHAGFVTGKQLLDGFNGNEYAKLSAFSYTIGSFDAYEGTAHCAPTGTESEKIADMTKRFLELNPDKLDKPADLILARLFNLAWPCKKPQTNL